MHGGARVIAQFLQGLGARHRVALLYLATAGEAPPDPALIAACERVDRVELPWGGDIVRRLGGAVRVAAGMARGMPRWVAAWRSPALHALVRETARVWRPDVVQIEFHVMGQYVTALADCAAPRVLTVHEPGVSASGSRSEAEGRRWDRYERWLLSRVDAAVTFTEADETTVAALAGPTPVVRIPFGTDVPGMALDPAGTEPAVLFVGGFAHPPNVDAALWLARSIWPKVVARNAGARLWIVGDAPPADVRALAGPRVVVTGRVDDVAPYLDRAAVVVAPLRLGGGMRVKVLEALAAGKALVATPLALAGVPLERGAPAVVSATDAEIANAVALLLEDEPRRTALGRAARAWSEATLGWTETLGAYDRLYERLLASPRRGR
jgi:glycosyltransferase involved in cell wall biosynthesis